MGVGVAVPVKGVAMPASSEAYSHSWTTWSGRVNPASGRPFSCISVPFYNMREQVIEDQLNLNCFQSTFIYSLYN